MEGECENRAGTRRVSGVAEDRVVLVIKAADEGNPVGRGAPTRPRDGGQSAVEVQTWRGAGKARVHRGGDGRQAAEAKSRKATQKGGVEEEGNHFGGNRRVRAGRI